MTGDALGTLLTAEPSFEFSRFVAAALEQVRLAGVAQGRAEATADHIRAGHEHALARERQQAEAMANELRAANHRLANEIDRLRHDRST